MSSQNKIIVPCSAAHLAGLLPSLREADRKDIESVNDPELRIEAYCANGLAITAVVDGRPIAMGGVIPIWEGVAEAWGLTGDLIDKHPKWYFQEISQFLDRAIQQYSLHRLQVAIRCDNEKSYKFHLRLGYVDEGVMKQYGADKSDYWRMAKPCHS